MKSFSSIRAPRSILHGRGRRGEQHSSRAAADAGELPLAEVRVLEPALVRLQPAQRLGHVGLRLPLHRAEAGEQVAAVERLVTAVKLKPRAGDKKLVVDGLRVLFAAVVLQRRRARGREVEVVVEGVFRTGRGVLAARRGGRGGFLGRIGLDPVAVRVYARVVTRGGARRWLLLAGGAPRAVNAWLKASKPFCNVPLPPFKRIDVLGDYVCVAADRERLRFLQVIVEVVHGRDDLDVVLVL